MNSKNALKRTSIVVLGSLIMGVGIYLTIIGKLGSDPLTMLWMGVSDKLSISVGQANLLVTGLMLIVVFFMNRKEIFIGSLLNPIVISLTTDVLAKIPLDLDSMLLRVIVFLSGLGLMAFGIALYALAGFGRGAYEALVFSLNEKLHVSIRIIRTSFDIFFAIAGFLLGASLSIAPFLAILLMGSWIQFFIQKMIRPMARYLGDEVK